MGGHLIQTTMLEFLLQCFVYQKLSLKSFLNCQCSYDFPFLGLDLYLTAFPGTWQQLPTPLPTLSSQFINAQVLNRSYISSSQVQGPGLLH